MINLEQIKIGDRIQFRAVTRHSGATVWRVVTGVEYCGQLHIQVRYHGWGNFHVRNHEIFDHEPRTAKEMVAGNHAIETPAEAEAREAIAKAARDDDDGVADYLKLGFKDLQSNPVRLGRGFPGPHRGTK